MNCWNYFDRCYCINLKHRTDRRRLSELQFHKVGLLKRMEYVTAEQHPQNSEQGIFLSHMRCIQKGLESNAQCIAVFEDDVVFENFDPERVNQSVQFINRLDQWEVLFLGCLVSGSWSTASPAVRKIHYSSLAHAYVLKRPFAEKLIKIQWSGKPFDAMLRDLVQRAYAIYPSIAFQSNARSDNHRLKRLDLLRRLCGGLQFIQRMNERCHRNFRMILLLHLLAISAVAGWLIWIGY